jgi:hypothetical protein
MDWLELFYWVTLLFGLGYGVFGLLAGGLGGHDVVVGGHDVELGGGHDLDVSHDLDSGHAAASPDVGGHHLSPFNSLTIGAFSLAVGGFGLITYRIAGFPDWASFLASTTGALLLASALFVAVWRPLVRAQGSSSPDAREVVHALAKVRVSIPAEGYGEIVFVAGGSRMQLPARSTDGVPLASGTRVAIVRLHKGVAEVASMEDESLDSVSDEG